MNLRMLTPLHRILEIRDLVRTGRLRLRRRGECRKGEMYINNFLAMTTYCSTLNPNDVEPISPNYRMSVPIFYDDDFDLHYAN